MRMQQDEMDQRKQQEHETETINDRIMAEITYMQEKMRRWKRSSGEGCCETRKHTQEEMTR